MPARNFTCLLQLISPGFPLGAYNYSDALEHLVEMNCLGNVYALETYLFEALTTGSIRLDISITLKIFQAIATHSSDSLSQIKYWNNWLNGTRETKELRQQSIQMGNSLLKLLGDLDEGKRSQIDEYRQVLGKNCHYAIAFGIAVGLWEIDPQQAILGYLHSWVSNLVSAGVKLIPLGQTQGQQIIYNLHPVIAEVAEELMNPKEEHLYACTWGLSLASMNHETQYTRLFRS